jgi:hypothetical protein
VLRSRATSTSQRKTGSSLSSLLQSRSEAAAAKRAAAPAAGAAPLSPLPDIDSKDKHNPLAAAEYAHDIYSYYRRVEPRFAVPADYMKTQVRARRGTCRRHAPESGPRAVLGAPPASAVLPAARLVLAARLTCRAPPRPQAEINEKMRAILIDWLVEVHLKFKVRAPRARPPPARPAPPPPLLSREPPGDPHPAAVHPIASRSPVRLHPYPPTQPPPS